MTCGARMSDGRSADDGRRARRFSVAGKGLTLYPPALTIVRKGVMCLQLAPPRPPGTDVKGCTKSKGHGEVLTGRSWSEPHVIHTN